MKTTSGILIFIALSFILSCSGIDPKLEKFINDSQKVKVLLYKSEAERDNVVETFAKLTFNCHFE